MISFSLVFNYLDKFSKLINNIFEIYKNCSESHLKNMFLLLLTFYFGNFIKMSDDSGLDVDFSMENSYYNNLLESNSSNTQAILDYHEMFESSDQEFNNLVNNIDWSKRKCGFPSKYLRQFV
ncbi:hypothetical protein EDEG_02663 [Edhazardia aedis USNM 41457]|uniref:Uncharacterized protein n=1 Tax=Edhazardia aedis (strain USNM 41457) TaxID=1003232 RepID=J9D569_EDHAE|nr:hypothetical protein EDEG_02663 [Edhazardia aedis USNM 41457]|eukprot:EJW02951.1 hypothetical protein EDEG_02663 [Edhazardia aedis USNM 41457]